MSRPTIGIIGTGRAGTGLGVALAAADYEVKAAWSRSTPALDNFISLVPSAAPTQRPLQVVEAAELIFLTVPDSLVPVLAEALTWGSDRYAVHCSGALGLDVLAPAGREGAGVGSLHPLVSLASTRVEAFSGATIAIEADARTLPLLEEMARAIGGNPLSLAAGDRALYHAAAALVGNYTVTLFAAAVELFERLGLEPGAARRALLPLLEAVAGNLATSDPASALTGPVARGDVATVAAHLDALTERAPELVGLYRELGLKTVSLALEQGGIDDEAASELRQLLAADHKQEVPA
ncbi:MAG: Rossmann-like and DUF2520 domain-containing protein [Dehalococcoidia bacterium]